MATKQKILIVDDDNNIAELISLYLTKECFETMIVGDGESALSSFETFMPNLILLDLMLPGIDGFNLCRELRDYLDIPILIVSGRQTEVDKIRGFGLGADDYITKPFSPSELVARIKRRLQRYQQLKKGVGTAETAGKLACADLIVEPKSHRVILRGREIHMPRRERELLIFLMQHPGIVFSREVLYEKIWGLEALGDNATVAVHINRIRDKIEMDSEHPRYIETLRGTGYRFCVK